MKTKILKFGMPLMAFLLAIVFAFASNGKPESESTLATGYIMSNDHCVQTPNNCTPSGANICKLGTQTVFESGCLVPLRRP
jgi:hypothetical protein